MPTRLREVFAGYDGLNAALDEILGGYTDAELAVIVDFLQRSTHAGRAATDELADDDETRSGSTGSQPSRSEA